MILRKFGILFMSASKRKSVNTVIPLTLVAENASITVANDTAAVSYTHLDVYKRQELLSCQGKPFERRLLRPYQSPLCQVRPK